MKDEIIIDLNKFRTPEAKVFTGRDRGVTVRGKSEIDKLENEYKKIIIIIPSDLYSINPSFFEEFLYNVVKKLGKDEFNKRFEFINAGEYEHQEDLEEGIKRILRRTNAL
ncbi:MAG: DUF4325 domain-containing protein [Bacteroidia bacterium]|nr:DUF4325 domain-containing protein [Bacteroidia bacterium]